MARVKIIERASGDPAGKKVDVYPEVELVRTFVFKRSDKLNRETILPKIIQILLEIRSSKNKKIRHRDFPIWAGETTNSLGMELFSVAIPDPTSYDVFTKFYETLKMEESYLECGAFLLRDTGAEPIARYSYGSIIIYVDPFAKPEELSPEISKLATTIELRSWEQLNSKKQRDVYTKPTEPNRTANFLYIKDASIEKRHTLEIWSENREIIMEFVGKLKGSCGYKLLKKILWDYFGVGVVEEPSDEFSLHGCIRSGWLEDKNKSIPVRILISSNLDDQLKYVVLAHEFSHYIQHFPLILLGQIVEEQAWIMPEIELYYHHLLVTKHPNLLRDVELDAYEFASFFLLPPWMHPITKITNVTLERGQHPEPTQLIWRFLQPFFSDGSPERLSWADYDNIKENADREVLRAIQSGPKGGTTLFECMLSAALRAEKGELTHNRIEATIFQIFKKVFGLLGSTMGMNTLNARNYIKSQIRVGVAKEKLYMESNEYMSALAEFSLSSGSFGREIILPLEPQDDTLIFPRLPLIPASFNPEGDPEGDWQYLPAREESPYGTVEDWRKQKKRYGVILYRFESWQKEMLKKILGQ